jgi:hypothetical protein
MPDCCADDNGGARKLAAAGYTPFSLVAFEGDWAAQERTKVNNGQTPERHVMTHIWFKRKRYGWGWYPATWQGWLVIAGFFAVMLLAGWLVGRWAGGDDALFARVFAPVAFVLTAITVLISWRKGESPRWQWGGR